MTDQIWHIAQDGQQVAGAHGPNEVVDLVQGSPSSTFLVWRQGQDGWKAPDELPELAALLAPAPPAAPPASPAPSTPTVGASSAAGVRPAPVQKGMGLVRSLFDLRFENLVTPKMVAILYAISMVLVALGLLAMLFSGLTQVINGVRYGAWGMAFFGLVWVAISPLLALLYLAFIRVFFEIVVVFFKIRDDLHTITRQGED